jgi:hypothetical protein
VADRAVFSAGIASLQDNQYALHLHRVKKFLQLDYLFDESCGFLLSLAALDPRIRSRIKVL